MIECPNHAGAFDCAPFCELCEGEQEIKQTTNTKGKEMETKTATGLVLTDELAEKLLEEEGLSHPDIERLVRYVWLVQGLPLDKNGEEYYRENLSAWIYAEEESYYGEHENAKEFTRSYLENNVEHKIPNWLAIDYEATWQNNLRHDFTLEDNGRGVWVWADIY